MKPPRIRRVLTRAMARLGRRSFVETNAAETQGSEWRTIATDPIWAEYPIAAGVTALEISARLAPGRPDSARSVIARLVFCDVRGLAVSTKLPQVRSSTEAGQYFYPFEFMQGDAFRFVTAVPPGAVLVRFGLQHWRKLDRTTYQAQRIVLEPVELLSASKGAQTSARHDEDWAAERQLRDAVKQYADFFVGRPGPISADDSPFGEAIVEYYIQTTKAKVLAAELARRRLEAGRDREALALFPLASALGLTEAFQRRSLQAWAKSNAARVRSDAPSLGRRILVVGQAETGPELRSDAAAELTASGLSVEVLASVPVAQPSAGSMIRHETEPYEAKDVAGQVVRLADQIVHVARGRDVAGLWALSHTDVLAGASAASRLSVPLVYELRDLAFWMRFYDRGAWIETDEGQRERNLFEAALMTADYIVLEKAEDEMWLAGKGFDHGPALLISDAAMIFSSQVEAGSPLQRGDTRAASEAAHTRIGSRTR